MNDNIKKDAKRFFLHTPADTAQSFVATAEKIQRTPGVDYGGVLDNTIIPLRGGDVMAVLARPGHGKSSFMGYMARRKARQIVSANNQDDIVLYVTWEQVAEEIEAFFQAGGDYSSTDVAWGRVPMDVIRRNAIPRGEIPIWTVGLSNRHAGLDRPRMFMEYVYAAIEEASSQYGKNVKLVCMDYVQIVPTTNGGERMNQVDTSIRDTKELAMRIDVPVIVGAQAARRVDSYKWPIPLMGDAQWSSAIEQFVDKMISLWRPIRTHSVDEFPLITFGGVDYVNDKNLLFIRLLKQRFGEGSGLWGFKFKPDTLEMFDYVAPSNMEQYQDIGF